VLERDSIARFLSLVFRPLPRVWGVAAVGIPAVAVIGTWIYNYGLWAGVIALISLVVLLTVAGYRLQRQLDDSGEGQDLRDSMSILLLKGQGLRDSIIVAAGMRLAEERAGQFPSSESEAAKRGTYTESRLSARENEVEDFIEGHFSIEYVARFRNEAGLVPASPLYSWITGGWAKRWERLNHRLVRLEEVIRDVPRHS
jgi:hypothetical protein